MDSLDYKNYAPAKLDVKYDYSTAQNYEQNPLTTTSSSEDLDQELENLLLLMGEKDSCTQIQTELINDDNFIDPSIEEVEWLNPDDLVDSKEFQIEISNSCRRRFDYSVSHNNNYNYQANSTSYNYSPSEQNNYSYQADHSSSKFDYQSDQDSSIKFSHVPTANNDRFDYQFTNPTKFDRSIPTVNKHSSIPHQNNRSANNHAVLDVDIDQNTRVRLEVGASVSIGDETTYAAAYAKATIYRRG